MEKELFDSLTEGVSLGEKHPSYFSYEGNLHQLECHRFPSGIEQFVLVSVDADEYGFPCTIEKLLDVDHKNLRILVETEVV